ncbi:transposase [Paraburkholderia unamae]|uniref:Transposase n=1 Tax=Paraburkholderia unamae TaxID=219649 RepID=A0ABX5KLL7_9BURK|nr:transposase [Paraburkholderia unamae]
MASSRLPNDLAYSKQVLDCIYTFGLLMARLFLAPMDFACTGMIAMSMRELDRLKVIEAVTEARLMPWRAAERLGISRRQVERLVLRYRESGASGLVSRRRGGASNHQLPAGLAQRALEILRERYADFGPTLACEKLAECHGLVLSRETVRKLMADAGLWIPRAQRPPKVYQPRARRACLGELIQIDGSDHRWFEERAPACTLLSMRRSLLG